MILQKDRQSDGCKSVIETTIRLPDLQRPDVAEAPLNNCELFLRDNYTCLYCGERHPPSQLTRDYVRPLASLGRNHWTNVVTACQTCNRKKAGCNLTTAGLILLAVPYAPSQAEKRILAGRRVLVDQMKFVGRSKVSKQRVVENRQRGNCYA